MLAEDAEAVRYAFGDAPDRLTRRLTVPRGPGTALADDGLTDHLFLKAARRISAMRAAAGGRRPERGMSAS
ncbi:hypothetical protein WDV06_31890 [Streptomyces racemochromogenes]|uniref:Uncharacterized protein n=1 Tax=Streptomyces racemochromogenes TaxID=67353 RepID=A0ABW7PP43_9ACTN